MQRLVDRLAKRLAGSEREPIVPADGARRAAVAIVLHDHRVLLMKRVERDSDPWSGHISLPGGGHHAADGSLLATAIRETTEELGIRLTPEQLVGSLTPLAPFTSGPSGMSVTPFVFAAETALEPVCGPEAERAFWFPLDAAQAGTYDGTFLYPESQMTFPCWNYEGHIIWGLTRRILDDLLEATRDPASSG